MGLPFWKPREIQEDDCLKHQDVDDDDSWTILPHQIMQSVYDSNAGNSNSSSISINNGSSNNRHYIRHGSSSSSSSNSSSNSSSGRRSHGIHIYNHIVSPISSIPLESTSRIPRNFTPRRSRTNGLILTSSLMDRRRSSRAHRIPGAIPNTLFSSSSSSPPVRSQLDRQLLLRITEKEDYLEQLQDTVSLLDQFLSVRTEIGPETMELPSFITEGLPTVLETAAVLVARTHRILYNENTTHNPSLNGNETTLREMVDRLLQIPPYSTRIQTVENDIISAHRRITEQFGLLGATITFPALSSREIYNNDSLRLSEN